MDDDQDCVHDWQLREAGRSGRGGVLDTVSECGRCGAVQYEPGQAAEDRPAL